MNVNERAQSTDLDKMGYQGSGLAGCFVAQGKGLGLDAAGFGLRPGGPGRAELLAVRAKASFVASSNPMSLALC